MDELEKLAEQFKAFSDLTRLKLIKLLSESKNPLCVNALSNKLSVTQSAVSQHLRILKQAGIVTGSRSGYHVHYKIDKDKLKEVEKIFKQTFSSKPGKSA